MTTFDWLAFLMLLLIYGLYELARYSLRAYALRYLERQRREAEEHRRKVISRWRMRVSKRQ